MRIIMEAMGSDKLDMKTAFNGAMADPAASAKRVHLLWIGFGTEEPERMIAGHRRTAQLARGGQNPARVQSVARYRGNTQGGDGSKAVTQLKRCRRAFYDVRAAEALAAMSSLAASSRMSAAPSPRYALPC